ncbi:MAG: NYN domain-containing protein [Chloroflexota bacterium]
MTDRSKTVVMLIDWDNLQICHSRDAPGTELDLQALIALAQSYGTLVSARAYAEWNLLSERLAVYKAGIEPVFAPVMRPEGSPREGKSLADTVMVADGVDLLWTVAPDVFVLATSDKDMIPLARIAKQRGAAVVVLGSDLTAIPLVEMSNVFITYRQLLRELDRVSELEAPVGRAPARERRLRESRRPSSEPYGSHLGSAGGSGGGPIGAGGRGGPRPVGTLSGAPAPVTPLPPAPPIRRRISESVAPVVPVEPERALPEPAAPTSIAESLPDASGLGSELAPRRRRRRGGRGRRTGLGGIGESDAAVESLPDESETDDVLDGDSDSDAAAVASSPDDIDTAVLELLAARDRDTSPSSPAVTPPAESEQPSSVVSSARIPAAPEPSSAVQPSESGTTGSEAASPRPKIARTSFSSFGPPDVPARQSPPPALAPLAGTYSDEPTSRAVEPEAAITTPAPSTDTTAFEEIAAAVTMPDAVAPDIDPTVVDEGGSAGDDTAPAVAEAAASEARPTARPSRSRRSGQSSRSGATRRPRQAPASGNTNGSVSSSASTEVASSAEAGPAADAPSEGGEAPARPARRRRTRRPAGAVTEGAEAVSGEAGG